MTIAHLLSQGISHGRALTLPVALEDVERRAEFVHENDALLMEGDSPEAQVRSLGKRLRELATASAAPMVDVPDPLDRIAIALALWAGCLSAAKTIAQETRSGPNTPEERSRTFALIDATAADDPLFLSGVETAPAFKRLRGQPYFLDGVPADSPVRRYA